MKHLNEISIRHFTVNPLYCKKRNSFCWQHFGRLILLSEGRRKHVSADRVFCTACLNVVKDRDPDIAFGMGKIKAYGTKVSTGNLIRHLKDKHFIYDVSSPTQHLSGADPQASSTLKVKFAPPTGATSTGRKVSKAENKLMLARDIALWFCRSLIPFDTISDDGMVEFFKKYNVIARKKNLPERSIISREGLIYVYESMLEYVKRDILTRIGSHAALTADMWQDLYRRKKYVTVGLHFASDDSTTVHNYTLTSKLIHEVNAGRALSKIIQNIKSTFGLNEKYLHIVGNSEAVLSSLDQELPIVTQRCLGYALEKLVTVDGIKRIPEINNLVLKCKKICMALRYWFLETENDADEEQHRLFVEIAQVCENLEEDERFPVNCSSLDMIESSEPKRALCGIIPDESTDTPSRWICITAMIQLLISNFNIEEINNLLEKYNAMELKFQKYEWQLSVELIAFLKKIKDTADILSAQKTCPITVALLFRSELKEALARSSDDEKLIMITMKTNMSVMLDHRFPVTKLTVAAALLDCRFAKINEIDIYLEKFGQTRVLFLTDYVKEVVPEVIREVIANAVENIFNIDEECNDDNYSYRTITNLMKLAQKHTPELDGGQEIIEKECWKYFTSCEASDLLDGNVLKYWHNKRSAYPMLYLLANAILSVPATSNPTEIIFSSTGQSITAKKSTLNTTDMEKIIFVHDNYEACKSIFV